MLKIIPIEELRPGMFVEEVTKQAGSMKIKTKGWVRTEQIIESLKSKGILELRIDTSKTLDTPSPTPIASESSPQAKEETEKTSFDDEINAASQVYSQVKELQSQLYDNMISGQPINLDEQTGACKGLIDSLTRNENALACLTQIKDASDYQLEHAINSAVLMAVFAMHLKQSPQQVELAALAGLLHDAGMVFVQKDLLEIMGKSTAEQHEAVAQHIPLGVALIKAQGLPKEVELAVQEHHERVDGSGYPNGLTAEQISQIGKMIAIVDSYDAMTSARPYTRSVIPTRALQILVNDDGYDKELVHAFVKCIGIHPVGSVVKLKSNRIAMVSRLNKNQPTKPWVKVFYNINLGKHVAPKDVNLSSPLEEDSIEFGIRPEDFKVDFIKFFKSAILN